MAPYQEVPYLLGKIHHCMQRTFGVCLESNITTFFERFRVALYFAFVNESVNLNKLRLYAINN